MKRSPLAIVAIIFGVISAILFFGTLLLPSEFKVVRTEKIAAAPQEVSAHIQNIRGWTYWSPWAIEDTVGNQVSYGGPEAGVGQYFSWQGEKIGEGKIEIVRILPGGDVAYLLNMQDGEVLMNGEFKLEALDGGSTKVFSIIEGDFGFNPLLRIYGLFIDKSIGPDLEASLVRLKGVAEQR